MKSKKGLILALGLDTFIAEFTIKKVKPSYIVFLVTKETFSQVATLIQNINIEYQTLFIKDVFSSTEIVQETMNGIEWLKNQKEVVEIIVDATNTLTIIEMNTYITASIMDIYSDLFNINVKFKLVYVHNEFEKTESGGFVEIKGTEKLIELDKPKESLSFVLAFYGIQSFNNHSYKQSEEVFEKIEQDSNNELKVIYTILKFLSKGYFSWEALKYEEALNYFKKIVILTTRSKNFKILLEIDQIVKKNIIALKKLISNDRLHLVIDIFTGVLRIEKSERLDGATARLYSSLEKITQFELYKFNIETKNPNYNNLNSQVVEDFKEELSFLPKELELKKNVLLLYLLKNPIGKFIYEKIAYKKFIGLIGLRNKSIYAHGNEPITEKEFYKFKEELYILVLEQFLKLNNQNMNTLIEEHTFFSLKAEHILSFTIKE